ncbi:unnamed protein product [Cuscuta campestris]|uniref:Carbonic anhydrase n=1 Tax=Cuscuta campestris TaxID=132261 RepID=A0A484L9U6_9ASTE|nr:unnamed protein product [Cuscuta campestris]
MELVLAVGTLCMLIIQPTTSSPFSYSGSTGPDRWASLSPDYVLCSTGRAQSPVSLAARLTPVNPNLKALDIQFQDSVNATLVNNGYNVQLSYGGEGGVLKLNGTKYSLKELHWHSPSEHQVFRISFGAEVHLVYNTPNYTVVVVSIIFRSGQRDPLIATVEQELSGLPMKLLGQDPPAVALGDINGLQNELRKLTNTNRYYTYKGSLTTPPCTEDVTWIVIGKYGTISNDQVQLLKRPLDNESKNNPRPLQPLNGRRVEAYQA